MTDYKLTRQLLKKFENPGIEVKVYNGTFKVATATVTYANGWTWVVQVERTHPILEQYAPRMGDTFLVPTSKNSHTVCEIPEELMWVRDELNTVAEISNQEAYHMRENLLKAIDKFYKEMEIS